MKLVEKLRALFAAPTQALNSDAAFERFIRNIHSLPDYDETLRRIGLRRHELSSLTRDEEISQCIDTRMDAVLATPWRLEPNQSRNSKWLHTQITPHFETLVKAAIDATMYGYSVVEVVYTSAADDGLRAGIKSLEIKPMEWFEPRRDSAGALQWWCNIPGGDEFELDPRKFFVLVRRGSYKQPQGEPLLARLWWCVFFKTEGLKQWNRFLEVFGAPIVIGKVNAYNQFIDAMQAQGVRSTVAWQPTGADESITTISASAPGEFERMQNAMNAAIQKLILGQTLTSQVGSSGSYAAAQVHNEVRADKRNSDIRMVTRLANNIIDQVAALNSIQPVEFVLADDTGLEMERAQRDALLVEKGVLKLTKEYLLDRYDYNEADIEVPETPDPAEAPEPAAEAPAAEDDGSEQEQPDQVAMSADAEVKFTPAQQAIETLADASLSELDGSLPIPLDDIRAAILAATDEADLNDRLALLLDNKSADFLSVLARAQFAAQVLGYISAVERVS